jgi:polyphosphate glucokinase
MTHTDGRARPAKPLTLAIDVGGSHLKAAVLKASGKISTGPLRVETPKPATPDAVVSALVSLSQQLGQFDRVSIGFPGVVRADFVLTAPNLDTKEWHGFRLGAVLAKIWVSQFAFSMMPAFKASGSSPGEVLNAF